MTNKRFSERLIVAANQNVKERDFWINKLSGELEKSVFPYDNRSAEAGKGSTARCIDTVTFELGGELFSKLIEMSKGNDYTLHMILTTGIYVLINKYTGNRDILLGTPIYKQSIETEFINTVLALRNRVAADMTFKELLLEVRGTILEANEHYNYPIEILSEKLNMPVLGIPGDGFPLFDITVLLANIHDESHIQHIHTNINFSFLKTDRCVECLVKYNASLYKKATIRAIGSHFSRLMHRAVFDVDAELSCIDILADEEKRQLLVEFNDTAAGYQKYQTIHRLFEAQVERSPDHIAVVFEDSKLTYRELNARANRVAHLLASKGVKRGTLVGLMMDRSAEMMIGLLGILKAGGAYLPIDTAYPQQRILTMLNDSGARIVLTKEQLLGDIKFTRFQDLFTPKREPVVTHARAQIKDFDGMPIPDRSLIDYEVYHQHIGQGMVRNSITLQATRGCPFNCAFCHKIWPKSHVFRSAENLFREVKLYHDLGVRRFVFVDDVFNLDRENSTRFFELILAHNLEVHFHNPNGLRGDIMTKDYIDLMVEAGTVNISFGLETASPRLQKMIRKNLDIEKVCENLQYILDKHPHVTFELQTIHGFPTETEEEAMMTLDLIKRFKWIDIPYVHLLKIHPNSDMARLAIENGISFEAIEQASDSGYHVYSDTIPFPRSFTTRYQSILMNEYFLSKERLLAVLPRQMRILKRDELVQKYDSYLPAEINSFPDLLDLAGISRDELGDVEFLDDDFGTVPQINEKLRKYFHVNKQEQRPKGKALNVLLLDLSMTFSSQSLQIYDIADTPLGLMYLLTYLKQKFGDAVNGKIAKARIDFDGFQELRNLLEDFKPDVIGIRTLTYFRNFFHKTIALLRQWGIDAPIIAGGPYASSDYMTLLKDCNIDIAVPGEGEITFAEIIEKILDNGGRLPAEEVLERIDGVAFMKSADREYLKRSNREIIMLDQIQDRLAAYPDRNQQPGNVCGANDPVYVIYTSGTMGIPKGVMLTHQNLNNLMSFQFSKTDIDFRAGVLQFATISFDVSFQEIFSTLLSGGELHLIDHQKRLDAAALFDVIERSHIKVVFLPTSFFKLVLNDERYISKFPGTVDHIITAGEQLVVMDNTMKYLAENSISLHNHYGPAETHVVTTLSMKPGEKLSGLPPIGKPISNNKIYIINEENLLQPEEMIGELCISGDSVGRGYLNDPELTSSKFKTDPFTRGKKMYKTGDLARWLRDGNIEFRGRKDYQVKIRGFRVEPGEIESRLLKIKEIKEAVVVAKETAKGSGDRHLCAYIVPYKKLDMEELAESSSAELPDFMVPSHFVQLDRIPLTANGKVDRKRLPEPEILRADKEYIAPRNEIEKKLVAIWQDVLEVEPIGIHDNFFDLGGNSFKLIKLMNIINDRLSERIRIVDLFHLTTVSQITGQLSLKSEQEEIDEFVL